MRSWVAGAAIVVAAGITLAPAPATAAPGHALIQGTGSTWAYNAVDQWIADVAPHGLQRSSHGRWVAVDTGAEYRTRSGFGFTVYYRPPARGAVLLRVLKPASATNAAGWSPTMRLRAT